MYVKYRVFYSYGRLTQCGETSLRWGHNNLLDIETENDIIEFSYNVYGQRTRKDINQTKSIAYYYEGDTLIKEDSGTDVLVYLYDEKNLLYGLIWNGVKYFYQKDVLGNISAILDSTGNSVVQYRYDPFGKILSLNGSLSSTLGTINPFRYKGYYYDVETQHYWVSSRYYSPELCRFISPDDVDYLDPSSINGLNLYIYANNNPIGFVYKNPSIGELTVGRSCFLDSKGFSIKFPSHDWLSLGIDFTASMAGALSVLKWTLKNPEFYEFWYTTYGISKHEMLSNLKSPMSKIASVISYGLVVYDIYTDVMGHVNAGDSWKKTVASGIVTAGVGVFNVWASAKVGAVVGAAIGGVPGFLIGIAAGTVVGIVIKGIFYTEINGKSIAGHIEDGIESFLEWIL